MNLNNMPVEDTNITVEDINTIKDVELQSFCEKKTIIEPASVADNNTIVEEELECHRKEKETVEDKLANVGKQENPIVEKISFEEPPNSEEKLTLAEEESDNIEDTKTFEQQTTFEVNLAVDTFTSNDIVKKRKILKFLQE